MELITAAAEASRDSLAADRRVFDLWDEIRLDHQVVLLVDDKANSRIEARREEFHIREELHIREYVTSGRGV